jgi:hypothetical protein
VCVDLNLEPPSPLPPLPAADMLDDLHVYDPTNRTWTDLSGSSASGPVPVARYRHGFTAAGGQLYVFGGGDWTGLERERGGREGGREL